MRRRKGLAIVVALLALMVVALAITALTAYISDEAHRSIDQAEAAQVEQMLLAATYDAKLHLNSSAGMSAGQSLSTDLPTELTEQGGKLQITAITMDTEHVAFQVVAHLGRRMSSQSVHFQKRNGNWELLDAQLE